MVPEKTAMTSPPHPEIIAEAYQLRSGDVGGRPETTGLGPRFPEPTAMVTPTSLPRDDTLPGTLAEFVQHFGTEEACEALLRRWKYRGAEDFRCSACGCVEAWYIRTRRIDECRGCGRQASLTSGTVFHGTRKPLRLWFLAMYLMTSSKRGISAAELGRQVGISYPTAWAWLHKLRSAMGRRTCGLLEGTVEVDESYKSGVRAGKMGRSAPHERLLVGGALESLRTRRSVGRVRLRLLDDASRDSLADFVTSTVSQRSYVVTDGWPGYRGLEEGTSVRHRPIPVRGSGREAHQVFPGVHRVFSLLERFMLGTYHGRVSRKHAQAYLDEYEFRFNRRKSRRRGLLFQRLLALCLLDRPPTYRQVVGAAA